MTKPKPSTEHKPNFARRRVGNRYTQSPRFSRAVRAKSLQFEQRDYEEYERLAVAFDIGSVAEFVRRACEQAVADDSTFQVVQPDPAARGRKMEQARRTSVQFEPAAESLYRELARSSGVSRQEFVRQACAWYADGLREALSEARRKVKSA